MRASLLKGAARGWLSKGNSSSQAGDAESMKRVAKLPSAREKASFQAAREMFCCCCWLCCKCTKIMYCHLLVVPSSKKTSLCEAVMWFQQSSGKGTLCTTESLSAELYLQLQTKMRREYQESVEET